MKKNVFVFVLACIAFSAFSSCENSDNGQNDGPAFHLNASYTGVYILNEGSVGKIDSKLTYFDSQSHNVEESVFLKTNRISFGQGVNYMLAYGHKLYVTVTSSHCIWVTNLNGKLLKTIPLESPRHLVAYQGCVYASSWNGSINRIDTTTYNNTPYLVEKGAHLEQEAIVGSKLYVAVSSILKPNFDVEKEEKEVAVFDLTQNTLLKSIQVNVNPVDLAVLNENLYVLSQGDYKNKPWRLQQINTETQKLVSNTALDKIEGPISNVISDPNQHRLLMVKTVYEPLKSELLSYDADKKTVITTPFVKNHLDEVSNAYALAIDPVNHNLYITNSDYISEGHVCVFDPSGHFLYSFKSGGITPSTHVSYRQVSNEDKLLLWFNCRDGIGRVFFCILFKKEQPNTIRMKQTGHYQVHYAKGFRVKIYKDFTQVTVTNPWDTTKFCKLYFG